MRRYPTLVALHDREHGDIHRVQLNAELPLPLSIHSFTDTHPEDNPHNDNLRHTIFYEADYLFIHNRLLRPVTSAARLAIKSSCLSSAVRSVYGIFDDDYKVELKDGREMFVLALSDIEDMAK